MVEYLHELDGPIVAFLHLDISKIGTFKRFNGRLKCFPFFKCFKCIAALLWPPLTHSAPLTLCLQPATKMLSSSLQLKLDSLRAIR